MSLNQSADERFFGVTVYDHDGQIVTIEPAMLSGRDIGEREAFAIRAAIRQLAAFVGPERTTTEDYDLPRDLHDWRLFCVNHNGFSGPTHKCPTCTPPREMVDG